MSVDKKQTLLQQCVDFSEMSFGKNNWNIPLNLFWMVCYFFFFFFCPGQSTFSSVWKFSLNNSSNHNGTSQVSQFVKHTFIRMLDLLIFFMHQSRSCQFLPEGDKPWVPKVPWQKVQGFCLHQWYFLTTRDFLKTAGIVCISLQSRLLRD